MIKKAQIKFICIIMSILLGVFGVILGVTSVILQNINNRNVDAAVTDLIKSYTTHELEYGTNKTLILKFANDNTLQVVHSDKNFFSEKEVYELAKTAIDKIYKSGRVGEIYYKITSVRGEEYLFAMDMSESLADMNGTLLSAGLIFLVIYLVLFSIVYLFSFSVFEPIKESFARQKQFVSNASHELKTPLTIISANADVLRQGESNQWIDNIKTQTERLDTIITDMLEMAKIDEKSQALNKEDFNLSDEIIKNSLPFDALAFEKGKNLDLDVTPDLNYRGNIESVKKIINILLDNALKYASKDGIIRVSLKKKNGKILLSVYNTGSAVPTEQANKIFERFYRFDNSRSRQTGGSGLGLSIAKGIADANKWKISAVSHPGEYMIINVIL